MDKFNKLQMELEEVYKDCGFKTIENDCFIEIIYNNKDYQDDEKFMDEVFEICKTHLTEDDLWKLAITFDYLKQISI